MSLDTVVIDSLRIAKAVRVHLNEIECMHSIKEIVREALAPSTEGQQQSAELVTTFTSGKNGDYRDV